MHLSDTAFHVLGVTTDFLSIESAVWYSRNLT